MQEIAKFLVTCGIVLVIIGVILHYSDRLSFLGRLPGDIRVERENFRFYMPITTTLLIGIILTFILNFLLKK